MKAFLLWLRSWLTAFLSSPTNSRTLLSGATAVEKADARQLTGKTGTNYQQTQPCPGSSDAALLGDALTLAGQLRGKTLRIPDLRKTFADWPCATNKHAKKLEGLVDSMLERIISDERKLRALKRADFARLLALWYPDAEWEELVIATAYSVWIFVWDDEVDAGDTAVSTDEELTRVYARQSRNYVRQALGLDEGSDAQAGGKHDGEEAPNTNMVLFTDVGRGMRTTTDLVQRKRFFRELEYFMLQVGIEHTHRLRGSIPSTEKYMEIRSGSVGCAPQISITDYMLRVRLPESIMESEAMKSLWRETVIICLVLNDIYSVQKEIAQGSFFNIVPVMFKNSPPENQKDLESVTAEFMAVLEESMRTFETAVDNLTKMTADDAQLSTDTQAFIKWCRYFITGVLEWSLESRRYGMAKCIQEDGSLSIPF
ncbi:isoprenoid synthase domain-containing protein [Pseudomassariella vexata]|uniref:Terpene synthase n=1 Tax=Pseudomassariella vexata TaxID=1141098 RepID=A0A1Y2DZ86_9PEZI|nr:isoprenoid synthase domain-containing protein [Pseudomassariella vexata]ORY63945.1 isoprenoid synthase domain-containing protein [Pseudomassariella vexata]